MSPFRVPKARVCFLLSSMALVGCAADTGLPSDPLTRDEIRALAGKADDGGDLCAENGLYEDSVCDEFCPQADPVCGSALDVQFLGVGGFLIRHGDDAVMTAPLYTNPNLFDTTLGRVQSDQALIDRMTADLRLDDVAAILVGHAHYDHLMDVPAVFPKTPNAQILGNRTMKHILAAWAPDRADRCAGTRAQTASIPRDRVMQLDDPLGVLGRDLVDYRMCPDLYRGTGDGHGDWVYLADGRVRVRALCSQHPAQFAFYHFGEGAYGADLCTPPERAESWLEGLTLAYLIDFLDPSTGAVLHRLYYQDAPNDGTMGHVPPELLEEKQVDVALLCVGTFAQVDDHPGQILRAMQPRYTIGGHWEDFFRTQEQSIRPVPFHDVNEYQRRAASAISEDGATEAPVLVDGNESSERQFLPMPGTRFVFDAPASVPPPDGVVAD